MGHERVGELPKSRRWRDIVSAIGNLGASGVGGADVGIPDIARRTADNVRSQFRSLPRDPALTAALRCFITLGVAARSTDPHTLLRNNGLHLPEGPTPLAVVRSLRQCIDSQATDPEYGRLVVAAAADAVGEWYQAHRGNEVNLFSAREEPLDVWRAAGDGAGFCELSRLFFGRFTGRYLNYFLEREASAELPTPDARDRFDEGLRKHIDVVSRHAFETAKITQSFAAGWFNKHAKGNVPSDHAIRGFLAIALGKLSEELRREGERT